MIELSVTTNDQSGIAGRLAGIRQQLPFALSLAINNIVTDAQRAIQAKLPTEFHLRHQSFITNTVKIAAADRATKTNLVARVRIDPTRDFLAKFEDGGTKVPLSASALAVPIIRLWKSQDLIIRRTDPLNVKRLMALIQSQGGKQVGPFNKRGAKKQQAVSYFLMRSQNGRTLIMQRQGSTLNVVWAFEPDVLIPASLHFESTALETALSVAPRRFDEALARAIATAR